MLNMHKGLGSIPSVPVHKIIVKSMLVRKDSQENMVFKNNLVFRVSNYVKSTMGSVVNEK